MRCSNSDVQKKILVDVNKLVLSVLALVRIDLQKHEIEVQTQLDEQISGIQAIRSSYSK